MNYQHTWLQNLAGVEKTATPRYTTESGVLILVTLQFALKLLRKLKSISGLFAGSVYVGSL